MDNEGRGRFQDKGMRAARRRGLGRRAGSRALLFLGALMIINVLAAADEGSGGGDPPQGCTSTTSSSGEEGGGGTGCGSGGGGDPEASVLRKTVLEFMPRLILPVGK